MNKRKKKLHNLIFDIDGTLFSLEPMLFEIYRQSLSQFIAQHSQPLDLSIPSREEIASYLGYPWYDIYPRLFPSLPKSALLELRRFVSKNILSAIEHEKGTLFPKVQEILPQLYEQGYRLFVASNGALSYIQTILSTYKLQDLFYPVMALQSQACIQNKADILQAYATLYCLEPSDTLMIGDRTSDFEASQRMNCLFLGCAYGYGSKQEIQSFPQVIHHFEELWSYLLN